MSNFKKIVCHTCGQVFAVTEDLLRARQWMGRYSLICPLGHYTQFSNRMTDSVSLIEDLRRRIAQMENPLSVLPLEHSDLMLDEEEREAWAAKAGQIRKEIEAEAKDQTWKPKPQINKADIPTKEQIKQWKAAKTELVIPVESKPEVEPKPLPEGCFYDAKGNVRLADGRFAPNPKGKSGTCPYCHKDYARVREHARKQHKPVFNPGDFVSGGSTS